MAEVWVDGQDRLFANMSRCFKEIEAEAKKGLYRAGMTIIADAQRNMRTAGHNGGTLNATGRLSNSGKVQDIGGGVDVGFFSPDGQRGYAAVVEYGGRAHWAPIAPLKAWARKKLRVPEKDVESAAYAVRWRIRKKGTRPHPFFGPAVNKNRRNVLKALADAVRAVTNKQR